VVAPKAALLTKLVIWVRIIWKRWNGGVAAGWVSEIARECAPGP
jgi:hypothetical protein